MLMIPDPTTARIDPYTTIPTMYLVCDLFDPTSRKRYDRDPRGIAQRAEAHLKESGIGDTAYMGPEPEFFVFDNVRFDVAKNASFHKIDSIEAHWNSGSENGNVNAGYTVRPKAGYFPIAPHDTLQDIRSEMVLTLEELGIPVEVHHHEVGTAGQCEIDMRFDSLTSIADKVMAYKYVVRNTARKHGKVATFMPKPIFADNGSGMHVHQSIWKDGKNLFSDPGGYAGIGETGMHYIGGLLKHGPALMALAAPTVNSYRRLVPGYEAPVNLVYSARNRSAAVRIPTYSCNPKSKRLEFRCADTAANPYLLFSALLMAGLDGIKNRIDPGDPAEFDLFEADKETLARVKTVPGSLREVLKSLEDDHEFLLEGEVFSKGFIENWIDYKLENEVEPANLRISPYEFYLYFDV
jgi:glutamine synthetase